MHDVLIPTLMRQDREHGCQGRHDNETAAYAEHARNEARKQPRHQH